jgi:hypothetical protein
MNRRIHKKRGLLVLCGAAAATLFGASQFAIAQSTSQDVVGELANNEG